MMETSAQPGEEGRCTPTPLHYIYHILQSCGVRSSWEGIYTSPISTLPYMNSLCIKPLAGWVGLGGGGGGGSATCTTLYWVLRWKLKRAWSAHSWIRNVQILWLTPAISWCPIESAVSLADFVHRGWSRVLEWTGVAEGRRVGGEGVILYFDGKVNVTPDVVGVAVSFWQSSCSYTSTVNVLKTKPPILWYRLTPSLCVHHSQLRPNRPQSAKP